MRPVSDTLEERLESKIQTKAENANPATYFRVMRHEIPLSEKQYLERTKVKSDNNITDSDVAVCHPKFGKADEDIWVCYITDGDLKIRHAKNTEALSKADWITYEFTDSASACAIAFDSNAKKNVRGIWEFVTEKEPWVFWVNDGQLKARKCTPLGAMEITLAESNVTDVSAVRGPSGEYGLWDFGLTVFYVMAGRIYYKQLINDVWYDSELVSYSGISELTISQIKAFNTWDHRVGIQILTNDNKLYEIYSYCEGIGTRGTEHLGIGIDVSMKNTRVRYNYSRLREHLEMGVSATGGMTYGLSAVPVSAENLNSTVIEITMDYPCTSGQASEFLLTDSNGVIYTCESMECEDNIVRLEFIDFSLANEAQNVTVTYTKGTLLSPATETDSFEITFVPTGLQPPVVPRPSVSSIYNL